MFPGGNISGRWATPRLGRVDMSIQKQDWRQVVAEHAERPATTPDNQLVEPQTPAEPIVVPSEPRIDKHFRLNDLLIPARDEIQFGLQLLQQLGEISVADDYQPVSRDVTPVRIAFTADSLDLLEELKRKFKTTQIRVVKAALHYVRWSPLSRHYIGARSEIDELDSSTKFADFEGMEHQEFQDQRSDTQSNDKLPILVSDDPELYPDLAEAILRPSRARDKFLEISKTDAVFHAQHLDHEFKQARTEGDQDLQDLISNSRDLLREIFAV